jgi:PTH1 family peptidyl-tRNA hydrolase
MTDGLWLIAGLGNPGNRYAATWHNSGYQVIDLLATRHRQAVNRIRFSALTAKMKLAGTPCLLLKPLTYMNLSGEALQAAVRYYKIGLDRCLVIYDDIDLDLGQIRIRESGGPGSHNGMKSIIQHLADEAFPRIRIGIGPKPMAWDLADYVLSDIPADTNPLWQQTLTRAADAVELVIRAGTAAAMNQFNRR